MTVSFVLDNASKNNYNKSMENKLVLPYIFNFFESDSKYLTLTDVNNMIIYQIAKGIGDTVKVSIRSMSNNYTDKLYVNKIDIINFFSNLERETNLQVSVENEVFITKPFFKKNKNSKDDLSIS